MSAIPRRTRPERKRGPRRQRKSTRAQLIRDLDRIIGERVRARGRCESGRGEHNGGLQWSHGFSRRYIGTRWDERNGFAHCAGCHLYWTYRSQEFEAYLQRVWGMELYLEMQRKALTVTKYSDADLSEMLERAKRGETL